MRTGYEVRADVVGSLLRPDFLVTARKKFDAGEIDHARLKEIEDRAVDDAIDVQTSAVRSAGAPRAQRSVRVRRRWKATG